MLITGGVLFDFQPNEAERLFNKYLRKGKQFEVSAFNKLLHGWAQKGNLMSVKLVFNLLKNEGLEPDMGTYAALLHGYGKYSDVTGVKNVINEMKEKVSFILIKTVYKTAILAIGYFKDLICYLDHQLGIFT